ncbi:hypothetical protein LTR70_010524 [Exophiala xenobiotica]|uniref:NACHT-NTPase and P-loop NTPases N-terminal domain-containing protein n=1 Tax=Lithohypha guttulata TaxID=1690604 RepID=A0ABR0JUB8_9EURO|nr:hypothetical protein LTR24_010445 [Lithohypha guttulata]KAK5309198.1 hypothetical protein LTR70_010524 [Exophiala xenobiotica]
MTGMEVIGGISAVIAIIAIIDGSIKVWEDNLRTCQDHFEPVQTSLSADVARGLVKTIESCRSKAEKLETIYTETVPGEDDQRYERYRKVVQRLGKGSKVEELMKALTEDAQNLVNYL